MKNFEPLFNLEDTVALISIHPEHANNIMRGGKNVEFRRSWPVGSIKAMVVYSTHPEQRIVGLVEIVDEMVASKTALWRLAREAGGGVTRRGLFSYLSGKDNGVAIRLGRRYSFDEGLAPRSLFGHAFRPPQSFRYLRNEEKISFLNISR